MTLDNDEVWLERFYCFCGEYHAINYVQNWEANYYPELTRTFGRFGLALIDHRPAGQRPIDMLRLKGLVDVIVVHDSERGDNDYQRAFSQFEEIETYRFWDVWTTAFKDSSRNCK